MTGPDAPSTDVVNGDGEGEGAAGSLTVQAVVRPGALAEDLALAVDGVPEMALRWTDDNGDNVAILSRRDDASQSGTIELFADHYVVSDGQDPRRLRHVQDGVIECDLDEFADFLYGSFRVTDADSDGLGKVMFAYHYTCAGDVSPASLKVLALEDGAKYIVRGQSWSSPQAAIRREVTHSRLAPPNRLPRSGRPHCGSRRATSTPRRRYGEIRLN